MEYELEVVVQGKNRRVLSSSLSGSIHEDESEVSVSLRKIGSEKAVANKHPQLSTAAVADATSCWPSTRTLEDTQNLEISLLLNPVVEKTRDPSAKMALRPSWMEREVMNEETEEETEREKKEARRVLSREWLRKTDSVLMHLLL